MKVANRSGVITFRAASARFFIDFSTAAVEIETSWITVYNVWEKIIFNLKFYTQQIYLKNDGWIQFEMAKRDIGCPAVFALVKGNALYSM